MWYLCGEPHDSGGRNGSPLRQCVCAGMLDLKFLKIYIFIYFSLFFLKIGQRHGGFLGIIQRALARASAHIWFERSEVKDRETVAKR